MPETQSLPSGSSWKWRHTNNPAVTSQEPKWEALACTELSHKEGAVGGGRTQAGRVEGGRVQWLEQGKKRMMKPSGHITEGLNATPGRLAESRRQRRTFGLCSRGMNRFMYIWVGVILFLCIFGCAGSLLLQAGFLQLPQVGATL